MTNTDVNITKKSGAEIDMSPIASDFGADGTYTEKLEVEYLGKTVEYDITIINDIRNISMATMPKTSYNVNEAEDLTTDGTTKAQIKVERAVGDPTYLDIDSPGITRTGFATNQEYTNKEVTVSYTENGITKTTSYNINVTDSVSSISITEPDKKEYRHGEALDVTGGQVIPTKGSGVQPAIDMTVVMVT